MVNDCAVIILLLLSQIAQKMKKSLMENFTFCVVSKEVPVTIFIFRKLSPFYQ